MSFFPRDLPAPAAPRRVKVDWEETACLLCGRRRWASVVEAPDVSPTGRGLWFAVVQCQDCGLCFTNPRPSVRSIASFYPPSYPPHLQAPRTMTARAGRRLLRLLGAVDPAGQATHQGARRLLDFGCGSGRFLVGARAHGWQTTGMEVSVVAKRAAAETGVPVIQGTLPHADLEAGSFDVITMRHSLEHVHEPLETLRQAYRLLAPGGKILVVVPNIGGLPFRWFGRAWVGLDLPRHLTHFTPRTLRRMLACAGFEVGCLRMPRHASWLRASAEGSCRLATHPFWHDWLTGSLGGSVASWYSVLARQTDCLLLVAERPKSCNGGSARYRRPDGARPME